MENVSFVRVTTSVRLVVLAGWRGRADGLIARAAVLYRPGAGRLIMDILYSLVAPGTQGHGHAGPDGPRVRGTCSAEIYPALVRDRESDKVVTVRNAREFIVEKYLYFSKVNESP